METEPFVPEDSDQDVCWFCPALRVGAGGFDVVERPSSEWPFDPADGFRYTAAGVPVCVHPYKVGLPPGRYGSDGLPAPAREALPARAATPGASTGPRAEPVRRLLRAERPRRRKAPPPTVRTAVLPPGLPEEPAGLGPWVHGLAGGAAPEELAEVLAGAEAAALTRFPAEQVLAVLRDVLSAGSAFSG